MKIPLCLRTEKAKIRLLEKGDLNIRQMVDCAIRGGPVLSIKAMQRILGSPAIHAPAVDRLVFYLNKVQRKVNFNPNLPIGAQKDLNYSIQYPTRERAIQILEELSKVASRELNLRIQNLLQAAPPSIEI